MPRDIGQRFLNDAVDGALGLGMQTAIRPLMNELDVDLVPAAEIRDERLQCRDESEIVKGRRVQEMREIADAVQCGVGAGLRIGQQRPGRTHRLDATFGNRQLDLHRAQRLTNVIVQLAGNPPLLLLAGVDEPC